MKVKSLVLTALMSALLVTGAVAAELKVGYVNTQRIFRDAPAAQNASIVAVLGSCDRNKNHIDPSIRSGPAAE